MKLHECVFVLLAIFGTTNMALADTLLVANFDDKTIDAPIGTGGAAVGEPVSVDPPVNAIVRASPFATPCLEITDNSPAAAGTARFEFLESAEITSGVVNIKAELWFDVLDNYIIYVREQGGSAENFASILFHDSGDVTAFDDDSNLGVIGNYVTGRVYPVSLVHDMGAGTYDIHLDGDLVVADEPHGVVARGVGSVLFGMGGDGGLAGRYYVDSILTCHGESPFPCCPADLNGDDGVATNDLLALLGAWGPCGAECPADLDGDGTVATTDLLTLLGAWGPCP